MLRKVAWLALLASFAFDLFVLIYLASQAGVVDADTFRPQLVFGVVALMAAFHTLALILNMAARSARP